MKNMHSMNLQDTLQAFRKSLCIKISAKWHLTRCVVPAKMCKQTYNCLLSNYTSEIIAAITKPQLQTVLSGSIAYMEKKDMILPTMNIESGEGLNFPLLISSCTHIRSCIWVCDTRDCQDMSILSALRGQLILHL